MIGLFLVITTLFLNLIQVSAAVPESDNQSTAMFDPLLILLFFIISILGFLLFYQRSKLYRLIERKLNEKELEFAQTIAAKIKDATKLSNIAQRASLKGKGIEQLAAFLPEFCKKYLPADARFLGSPIDLVVFKGMSDFNGGEKDTEITVVLIDSKTGNGRLNPIQKAVEKAVKAGRVEFETMKLTSIEQKPKEPTSEDNSD